MGDLSRFLVYGFWTDHADVRHPDGAVDRAPDDLQLDEGVEVDAFAGDGHQVAARQDGDAQPEAVGGGGRRVRVEAA